MKLKTHSGTPTNLPGSRTVLPLDSRTPGPLLQLFVTIIFVSFVVLKSNLYWYLLFLDFGTHNTHHLILLASFLALQLSSLPSPQTGFLPLLSFLFLLFVFAFSYNSLSILRAWRSLQTCSRPSASIERGESAADIRVTVMNRIYWSSLPLRSLLTSQFASAIHLQHFPMSRVCCATRLRTFLWFSTRTRP